MIVSIYHLERHDNIISRELETSGNIIDTTSYFHGLNFEFEVFEREEREARARSRSKEKDFGHAHKPAKHARHIWPGERRARRTEGGGKMTG